MEANHASIHVLIIVMFLQRFVGDRMRPGACWCLGDHRIRATLHQRGNGALIIGWIKGAVGAGCQLGDLTHHPALVLFCLRT